MDEDYERKLLDSGTASFEQLQYAVKAAQIAGHEIVAATNGESWVNSVTIKTSPQRTLSMCARDGDYWVTSGEGFLWPREGTYGFMFDTPFRKALHAFITGEPGDDLPLSIFERVFRNIDSVN